MHLSEGPEATDRLELKEAENKDVQATMLGWIQLRVGTKRHSKVLRAGLQCCRRVCGVGLGW